MSSATSVLLVAIDVGMTCTGVGFAIKNEGIDMPEPHTIQTWPGNAGGSANKVPTSIYYGIDDRISWGFLTQLESDQDRVRDWFKVFFDEAEYNKARRSHPHPEELPPSHADVRKYYEDFLRKLYPHIKKSLIDNVRDWNTAHVEFLFSVPTTWTKLGLAQDLKTIACRAGFGSDSRNHIVDVSLTEAEAAAVYTFNSQNAVYSDGDVLLTVDAGGGTTDVALLKVAEASGDGASLRSLDQVRGDEIGSVEIDIEFADLVEKRLMAAKKDLNMAPHTIRKLAEKMSRSPTGFRRCKENFGTEDSLTFPEFEIEMPGCPDTFSLPSAKVIRGRMIFSQAEIRALFDRQIEKMFDLIDFQMKRMDTEASNERIVGAPSLSGMLLLTTKTHLVLSGGLGSSQYVKDRLTQRYTVDRVHRRAPELRVMSSTVPQLAVVKGIVQNRMRKLKTAKSVLRTRTCRQSLGVLCIQRYNPRNVAHQQAQLHKCPIENKTYANDQVIWFVKQGQQIDQDEDHVDHEFWRRFLKGKCKPWEDRIVICNSGAKDLPNSFKSNEGAVKMLCTMRSDLTSVPYSDFEKRKKRWWRWWNKYETHYRADFTIRFQLKPASIDTQLLFKGQRYNTPNSFTVQWDEGVNMAAPKEHRSDTHNNSSRHRG